MTSWSSTPFTQLLRELRLQSSKRKMQQGAMLVTRFCSSTWEDSCSSEMLPGLYTSAPASSSWHVQWKQALDSTGEVVRRQRERNSSRISKYALHKEHVSKLPMHVALKLFLLSTKPYSQVKVFAVFILIHFVPGLLVEYLCWCFHQVPVQRRNYRM